MAKGSVKTTIRNTVNKVKTAVGTTATALSNAFRSKGTEAMLQKINNMKDLSAGQRARLARMAINKGFKKTATRAATMASIASSSAQAKEAAAKYNYQSYKDALETYNKIINQNPDPASDTGNPSDPQSGDGGNEVYPVGN